MVERPTAIPSNGGWMKRSILLSFCCGCMRCTFAQITNGDGVFYVDEQNIHLQAEPDPGLVVKSERFVLVLRERMMNLQGSEESVMTYSHPEWGYCLEAQSAPCNDCLAESTKQKAHGAWKDLKAVDKNRLRRQEKSAMFPSKKGDKNLVLLNGGNSPVDSAERDRPDHNREKGQRGKPGSIQNAGRPVGVRKAR